jgi:hypothetical protein
MVFEILMRLLICRFDRYQKCRFYGKMSLVGGCDSPSKRAERFKIDIMQM